MSATGRRVAAVLRGVRLERLRAGAGRERRPQRRIGQVPEPTSTVRILRDEKEIDDALARALRFDQAIQTLLDRRVDRYQRTGSAASASVTPMHTSPSGMALHADRRSA